MHKFLPTRLTSTLAITLVCAAPAFAQSKDTIRLQTQIQQLQDSVARLQQSNDERMGVLKDLVQQSADTVNRLSVNVDALQKQLSTQQTAQGSKTDQVSGQIQGINDSLDEVKARMIRLEKVLGDVQNQQQTMAAALQNLPQSSTPSQGSTPSPDAGSQPATMQPGATQPGSLIPAPSGPPTASRKPSAAIPFTPATGPSGPSVDQLYKTAYGDYIAAKYSLATSEFGDLIKAYPSETLTGNAYYYLGEIDYRAGKYSSAARNYDRVLEQFPDNNKIPASYLHKGQALIELRQNDAGIRELRALIQRFPTSPEAAQARAKLNVLGVPIRPRT